MSGLFSKEKGEELILKIEGMSCQHCVGKVQKGLDELDGVLGAEVDLEKKEARIRFDGEKVTEEAIRKKVADTGYQVV